MQEQTIVPLGPYGQQLFRACRWAALFGGLVFVGLVLMSIVSIVGRKLLAMPVPGDVELLQTCSAFAAASFFAYCHLAGGDVKVDFFTHHWKPSKVHVLDCLGSLLLATVGALLCWRSLVGALDIKDAGETTMILGWPLWIGQILMVPGFALLALAGVYTALGHGRLARNRGQQGV